MYYLVKNKSYKDLEKVSFMAIDEPLPNSFAALQVAQKHIGLAWNGKSEAVLEQISKLDLLLIGAGSSVVFISESTGMIRFSISLHTPFLFFLIDTEIIAIVSETTLTTVHQNTLSIERFTGIPDIIIDGKIEEGTITLYGMDQEFKFQLNSNKR